MFSLDTEHLLIPHGVADDNGIALAEQHQFLSRVQRRDFPLVEKGDVVLAEVREFITTEIVAVRLCRDEALHTREGAHVIELGRYVVWHYSFFEPLTSTLRFCTVYAGAIKLG